MKSVVLSRFMARPSKLAKFGDAIIEAVGMGMTRAAAARAFGVSPETVKDWMRKGREQKTGAYVDFVQAIENSENTVAAEMLKIIKDAAKSDPRYAQWWLERKMADKFGRRQAIQHSGTVDLQNLEVRFVDHAPDSDDEGDGDDPAMVGASNPPALPDGESAA